MVIENRERVAAYAARGEVSFEVHLPEVVRLRLLEALEVAQRPDRRVQHRVPAQDLGDGRGRRDLGTAQRLQPPGDLVASPGRVLFAQGQYFGFHLRRSTPRTPMPPARPVPQTTPAFCLIAPQPLVTCRCADLISAAQPAQR